jgi:hypothetical protein
MWTAGRTAKKVVKQPGAFALAVIKQFRANQGILLEGASRITHCYHWSPCSSLF